jgi:hypothetical protein
VLADMIRWGKWIYLFLQQLAKDVMSEVSAQYASKSAKANIVYGFFCRDIGFFLCCCALFFFFFFLLYEQGGYYLIITATRGTFIFLSDLLSFHC